MSITLHAKLVAKPEHTEDVKKQLLIIKEAADNNEDGCLTYRVNQKLNDKNTFIMFEEYKDEAAIEAHKAAPEFQGLATKAKDWLAEPFVIDLLQPSKL
ncbi:hypothetical protein QFC20_000977 [Naganishia adeliensis]|uniref:Uncharacterized protein n=1 Tax=Naganishia adeliensis TaxID=92952 RepID=A0ACC2WWX1_9TREE|nr:hypothetical protein QFC20_000977 [Naganishia adeliensis]